MNVFEIDRMLCVHYTFDQFRIQLMRIKKRTLFLYVESGVLYFLEITETVYNCTFAPDKLFFILLP